MKFLSITLIMLVLVSLSGCILVPWGDHDHDRGRGRGGDEHHDERR